MLKNSDHQTMHTWMDKHFDEESKTQEEWHPMCLHSLANASDTPTWEEAMNEPNKSSFWEAAKKEIETLEAKKA